MTPGLAPTRRLVLSAAGSLLLPRGARAQPAKRRRIVFLSAASRSSAGPFFSFFREGLRALGDGDVEIEERYAEGHFERLADLAAELVRLAPEVIVAASSPVAAACKQLTSTIPIVFIAVGDPVAAGFVGSLSRPGGNITGLSTQNQDLVGKWLELLKTATPGAGRIAYLLNPGNPSHQIILQGVQQAARTLRIELLTLEARTPSEIDDAFA